MAARAREGGPSRRLGFAFACRSALPAPLAEALCAVPEPADSEEALWRDVVTRAALDAIGHTSPVSGKNQHVLAARCVAEARAWFEPEDNPWRSQVFDSAGLDEHLICALVRAAIRQLEREQGVVAVPAESNRRRRAAADMPGTEPFAVVRGPSRPFAVETVRRRVSLRERESAAVIFSYLKRSAADAPAPR